MKKLLNTLFVTTQGAYLNKEGETVVVSVDKEKRLQLPILTLDGIVCFGQVSMSPYLMGFCAERNVTVSFLTEWGKFLASIHGKTAGNVLLRREQYRWADNLEQSALMARNMIIGKVANCRTVINRVLRDHKDKVNEPKLASVAKSMAYSIDQLRNCNDLDHIRGIEGDSAHNYFDTFNELITNKKACFRFDTRNRRPPLDIVNCLLSFVYTLLMHDIRSGLETVGLDPYVGFLHRDRPGRASLALDMMEEFRACIADRLVLSLINRGQIDEKGFTKSESGAVLMNDDTKKTVLSEYQKRKQEEITHPFLEEKVSVGLLFYIQALLLARYIRGDLDGYPVFLWK
ncbi:MAG: subtype I-C CRISPR-associated endonuclease Cas1 [Candidatus Margulisiibacteriota bacterium]|nr:MAG: subtype I-C CRISPR-associated endonuclease Cas1 [Candidatus Margulisbacteria bacterium GWD2_39_127]PZM83692.1 MAG: subtype I-C CRISPR-associated endonuclease Cas1 [Candidatus Margulisiibacteriota bacterium]HAR64188.1 subtype I-C CRISPR-associated endonuclease Cas1 [Candidatus Margulisiibacteriota bacterium]HCY36071.1 subtype I-C CRISPR-associated endonuclease Cas1 [Candidatus Margulisiibacteriota bacterium]